VPIALRVPDDRHAATVNRAGKDPQVPVSAHLGKTFHGHEVYSVILRHDGEVAPRLSQHLADLRGNRSGQSQ
jgi:hypothetical protein